MSLVKLVKGLFTHNHFFKGYGGGAPYLIVEDKGVTDGIGREHCRIYGKCDLCNEKVLIGYYHKNNKTNNES